MSFPHEQELGQYRNLRVTDIKPGDIKKVGPKLLAQLGKIEQETGTDEDPGLIFLIASRHLHGVSLNALAPEYGLKTGETLGAIFKHFGIPTLTRAEVSQAKWQDPSYRNRVASANRDRWDDPEFKTKHAEGMRRMWQDPQEREKRVAGIRDKWEDPEFVQAHSEGMKRAWEDPDYRAHMIAERVARWDDPEYRTQHSEILRQRWQDPEFRARQSATMKKQWENSDYRDRVLGSMSTVWHSERFRTRQGELLRQRRQNPVFNANNAVATRRDLAQRWQDPAFREKFLEAARRARLDPANVGRYNLPTIKGERKDIGFYAQSTWEANFARVLLSCGREFDVRQNFMLEVPEEYADLFPKGKTETNIDFLTLDPRGNSVLYEIMSYPKKYPVGWAKLEMLTTQYPMFRVVPVTDRLYKRLQQRFEAEINADPLFAGWETKKDNLKSNPTKFQ